ncbi:MAG: hypothetical protein FJZ47_06965 [Candidatus Tectomicrobia bacterium]|uniref:Rhodanese domain-containing protein n=1 Tax=Tectimicrobiota bacterium TaxID=2528274 RepID=A0A937W132_UNCTE|nr:hypothetical protein [Candidatus Tectomicrobia bacterium]
MHYLDIAGVQTMMARRTQETVYLVDVRTQAEFSAGHIPGFRWFPGGQAVQRSDEVAMVHNCPIVFTCDRLARATITASWYRQMGFRDVYVVQGGTEAWAASGQPLEAGLTEAPPYGIAAARKQVQLLENRCSCSHHKFSRP